MNVISGKTLSTLDSRFESKLTSVWRELKKHAESAGTRADRLEQHLGGRLGKLETTWVEFLAKKKTEKELEDRLKELQKLLEWLTWRITWLEWSTKGEERGFGRPLDEKAAIPMAPPQTVAATAMAQPLAEDMDLWVRSGSRQRLRRPLNMTVVSPGTFTHVGQQVVHADARYMQNPLGGSMRVTASRSQPRLPTLAK